MYAEFNDLCVELAEHLKMLDHCPAYVRWLIWLDSQD